MAKYKAVLFDADGVIVKPQAKFSHQFAKKYGINPEGFQEFFEGDFTQAIKGKADLKEIIIRYNHLWKWDSDPQELIDMWFESENVIDTKLIVQIEKLRSEGVWVCLATHQEKYRAKYMREVMFPDAFDDYFISCDIGATKNSSVFWDYVLAKLQKSLPNVRTSEVLFFDDDDQNVATANMMGINGVLYHNAAQLEAVLST